VPPLKFVGTECRSQRKAGETVYDLCCKELDWQSLKIVADANFFVS